MHTSGRMLVAETLVDSEPGGPLDKGSDMGPSYMGPPMYVEYKYLTVLAPVVSPQNEILNQVSW